METLNTPSPTPRRLAAVLRPTGPKTGRLEHKVVRRIGELQSAGPGTSEQVLNLLLRLLRYESGSVTELERLGSAMFGALSCASRIALHGFGRRQRSFDLRRKAGALWVSSGDLRVRLDPEVAVRLATLLHGARHVRPVSGLARPVNEQNRDKK